MSHGAGFTAFFDSSALYPLRLRDLLLRLARTDLFRARWSADVLSDWMTAYVAAHPGASPHFLEKQCTLMNSEARDSLVDGHQSLMPAFSSLQPAEAHVVAAAVYSRSDVIVTSLGRSYPNEILNHYRLHKEHPDEFIAHLIDLNAAKAILAVKEARIALQHPAFNSTEYLLMLERAGLPQTVSLLRAFTGAI